MYKSINGDEMIGGYSMQEMGGKQKEKMVLSRASTRYYEEVLLGENA